MSRIFGDFLSMVESSQQEFGRVCSKTISDIDLEKNKERFERRRNVLVKDCEQIWRKLV